MKLSLETILKGEYVKIVLSDPQKNSPYKKIVLKRLSGAKIRFQAEQYTATQVFHRNLDGAESYLAEQVLYFKSMYVWGKESYALRLSNGALLSAKRVDSPQGIAPQTHDRKKEYPIMEGEDMPIFVKLGIFTQENKVVRTKQDKFKQINRYIQMLEDVLKEFNEGDEINVVDYCCGKSYLSFAVYHYLTYTRKLKVSLTGIDLKTEVIENCAALAKEYGYDGMTFYAMDIKDYTPPKEVDLVISLHACDVATDYVLYSAIQAGAKRIFAVPCCQHECAKTLSASYEPLLAHYGILSERMAAMITDGVRAALLELNGYKTDCMEFVDITDSPKNLLLRAVKTHRPASLLKQKRRELQSLLDRTQTHLTAVDLLLPKDE